MMGNTSPNIVAQIIMRRTSHAGSFLIVEGKDDDRFWGTRRHDSCRLIVSCGKNNVISSLKRLDEMRFEGALGVVDSDYDYLADKPLPSENLVTTDAHDLECLLCKSSALNKALSEFGDSEKISRFEKQHKKNVRTALLERGLIFGNLRRVGVINIDQLISRFVNENGWAVDEGELICGIVESSKEFDADTLQNRITRLPPMDPWYVAQGHDLLRVLRIGLRSTLGNLSANTSIDTIAGVLRQAMTSADLQSTGLWQAIRRWEKQHTPFLVLADER